MAAFTPEKSGQDLRTKSTGLLRELRFHPATPGGGHSRDNYLAAHSLCNNYRWDYSAEEFQWILKIGVWARYEMEGDGRLGKEILKRFFDYECSRVKRRKIKRSAA